MDWAYWTIESYMIDPIKIATVVAWAVSLLSPTALGSALPDPHGLPADMSKPVQVYILLGQSNMIGYGKVARGVAGYVDASSEGYLDYAISSKGKLLISTAIRWLTPVSAAMMTTTICPMGSKLVWHLAGCWQHRDHDGWQGW